MVFGLGALTSIGAALPTGWLFGFGYGHGVRTGYNSFKPSKNQITNQLHTSPNPLQGSLGMGMHSAEEMTGAQSQKLPVQGLTDTPTPQKDPNHKTAHLTWSPSARAYYPRDKLKTHEDYQNWVKRGIYPSGRHHRSTYKRGINRKY